MSDVAIAPAPFASAPMDAVPDGACDTHSHIFGPLDRFPTRALAHFALPDARPEVHAALRRTIGVARGVLTQPAAYALDPAAMLHAVANSEGALKAVAVADASIDAETLTAWRAGGIVGLRFTEWAPGTKRFPGSVGFDVLAQIAPLLRTLGIHAQLWAPNAVLVERLPKLLTLGLPIVLDHMGVPDAAAGAGAPDFQALLAMVRANDVWVKLSICRVSKKPPNFDDARPFHDALIESAPERCLWGSDWPYVNLDPAPDAGALLDTFLRWAGDPEFSRSILVDNPARLYGF